VNLGKSKNCAYCNQSGKLTKEHIIPDWFIREHSSSEAVSYLKKADIKFVPAGTVKDVCENCNNISLSKLDQYGKSLHDSFFRKNHIQEQIVFKYDYQLLSKWLLKCTYNSARAHGTDLSILKDYAKSLISDDDIETEIGIYCTLLSGDENPKWFRSSVFILENIDRYDQCLRAIIINKWLFVLAIPKKGIKILNSDMPIIQKTLLSRGFCLLGNSGISTILKNDLYTVNDSIASHLIHNPITYNNIANAPEIKKVDQFIYIIPHEDILEENMKELEGFLLDVLSTEELFNMYAFKFEFLIDGYNDDPRDLWEIQEVVKYISMLNNKYPAWIFLINPEGTFFTVVLASLSLNSSMFCDKLLRRNMDKWFLALNKVSSEIGLDYAKNLEISTVLTNAIKARMSAHPPIAM
tara:strand:+ start:69 stop:1295 length:1227 start_codon:yes stop_codon:yes gene_type:complete